MRLIIGFIVVTLSVPLLAQTPPIPAPPVSVTIRVVQGGGDPGSVALGEATTAISATAGYCSQALPAAPTTPLINPSGVYVDDPFHPGLYCRASVPTNLPNGSNYVGFARFTGTTCQDTAGNPVSPCVSLWSPVGTPPFSVAAVLVIPLAPRTVAFRP